MGVSNPTETADMFYQMSRWATDEIIQAIKSRRPFDLDARMNLLREVHADVTMVKQQLYCGKLNEVLGQLDSTCQRATLREKNEKNISVAYSASIDQEPV